MPWLLRPTAPSASASHAKRLRRWVRPNENLPETKRKIAQVIRAIEDGGDTKMLAPRLNDLSAQLQELDARLALGRSYDVVVLHPQAAARYAAKVADIQTALSTGDAASVEAIALVRNLVQRVRVIPAARGEPVGLEIAGDLAALLTVNEKGTLGMVTMVAGARNRHYLLFNALRLPRLSRATVA